MLPPSKSEFDQHADGKNIEEKIHAKQTGRVDHDEDLVDPGTELDDDVDAGLDDGDDADDIEQEVDKKPKKKSMGKRLVIAAVALVGVVVALLGVTYFMQGQPKKPTQVSNKIAVDPSLIEAKPASNAPAATIASTELTPNLNPREAAPVGPLSSSAPSVTNISAPPSDPFGGSATAPAPSVVIAPMVAPTPSVVIAPVVAPAPSVVIAPGTAQTPTVISIPAPTPTPAAAVIIIAAPAGNVEGPRADPFGDALVKGVPTPATAEKAPKPIAEPVVKAEKPKKIIRAKATTTDSEEVIIVKPRVVKKVIAKKPSVVRQDMTRSEPHPSQESVQPQSNETFSGYEKLF